MTELLQLAPQMAVAAFVLAGIFMGVREMRKMMPNGKLDALAKQVEAIDERLDGVVSDVSYIRGKLDASAEITGRHAAISSPGE